ncbi:MAG: hypothetical protein KKG84_00970 [Candidatus Omnitrophica bacterium]|nr:hypothetical protein [Candidatus Omnitrophota bacterium]
MRSSREVHLKYREPFVQRIIAETNAELPKDQQIKRSLGSDIYKRDEVTGKVLKDEYGRKILNPTHRGMQGDLDLGGSPSAVEKLEKKFGDYGIGKKVDPKIPVSHKDYNKVKDAPGYRDFKQAEVTINIEGHVDKPGSSSHLTQVQMDAFSKETYVSVGMNKDQPGRKFVEVNDHIKKGTTGFAGPASVLLDPRSEDVFQGVGKATLKSIDPPKKPGQVQHVSDEQLNKILKETGYQGDVNTFKSQVADIKQGHLPQGVGLDEKNIKPFQEACQKTTEQALDNAKKIADQEFQKTNERIKKYDEVAKSPDTPEYQKKRFEKEAQKLRDELADSKVRIEQTTLANQEKLKGGNYDTFYEKKAIKPKALPDIPKTPNAPKSPRIDAIKNGLKPDLMSTAGYGLSAYNVYDNVQKYQNGEITKNDMVIGVNKEVVDTGFGIVTDLGTAAAVGGIGTGATGAVATVAAPLVVFAATGYAVSQAAEDGLKMADAFKDEEILEMISKSKTEEAINTMQMAAEEVLKAGEVTGDWKFFAKADDVIYAMDKLYQATGDVFYLQRSNDLADRVDKKKEELEKQYGCSIYDVKNKKKEEAEKEAEKEKVPETKTAEEVKEAEREPEIVFEEPGPDENEEEDEYEIVFEDVDEETKTQAKEFIEYQKNKDAEQDKKDMYYEMQDAKTSSDTQRAYDEAAEEAREENYYALVGVSQKWQDYKQQQQQQDKQYKKELAAIKKQYNDTQNNTQAKDPIPGSLGWINAKPSQASQPATSYQDGTASDHKTYKQEEQKRCSCKGWYYFCVRPADGAGGWTGFEGLDKSATCGIMHLHKVPLQIPGAGTLYFEERQANQAGKCLDKGHKFHIGKKSPQQIDDAVKKSDAFYGKSYEFDKIDR